MGQKVNPIIFRIGINKDWSSKWFARRQNYVHLLHQDIEIQKTLEKLLVEAGVANIEILRNANQVIINVHTAKPGIIIGRQGENVEALRKELEKKFNQRLTINIKEVRKPGLSAKLLAEGIARQIEKRISYRRAAKMSIEKALESGAIGAKIFVAGRLNGVEIARSEMFSRGKIPLHTLRADIDYACTTARTTYGAIGVKVWVYKGEVFNKKNNDQSEQVTE